MDKITKEDSIINVTRITVPPEHRWELFQTLSSLLDPLKKERGCLAYHFYREADDENTFVLIGEWETAGAWYDHLNSDNFAVLLGSISLLCDRVPIDFKLLSHAARIEELTRARLAYHA